MNKFLFLFLWTLTLNAQIEEPVEWKTSIKNINQDTYALTFEALMELYPLNLFLIKMYYLEH